MPSHGPGNDTFGITLKVDSWEDGPVTCRLLDIGITTRACSFSVEPVGGSPAGKDVLVVTVNQEIEKLPDGTRVWAKPTANWSSGYKQDGVDLENFYRAALLAINQLHNWLDETFRIPWGLLGLTVYEARSYGIEEQWRSWTLSAPKDTPDDTATAVLWIRRHPVLSRDNCPGAFPDHPLSQVSVGHYCRLCGLLHVAAS